MFYLNERVVCVDDSPGIISCADGPIRSYNTGLRKGEVYVVRGFFAEGHFVPYRGPPTGEPDEVWFDPPSVYVGVTGDFEVSWQAACRFRSLNKIRTEEGLRQIKAMFTEGEVHA